jgi:hypothetical protein
MDKLLLLAVLLLPTALLAVLWWRQAALRRRQYRIERLLDLTDEVELLLDRSRSRMQALQGLLGAMPEDLGSPVRANLDQDAQVMAAKKEVLRHRLWIKQSSGTASGHALEEACAAMQRVRDRLAGELGKLDRASAELAAISEAANEQARREPPSLRRHGEP